MSCGIAVVGTGYIGGEHMRAIAANPRSHLEVICSTERSRGVAEELRGTHGAARTTNNYDLGPFGPRLVDGCRQRRAAAAPRPPTP